jgi:phenylpropionate dioxygenase-like ring-hydroxylating dioxygenase large terminal subunit
MEHAKTGFLKNAWYVAAWADELGRELKPLTICALPVLLYRKANGDAVAIGNICPHRHTPLHLGKRIGDTVQCGYHGMVFGESGKCVHNPHHGGFISAAMQVPAYPVVEKHGIIWIWMGDAAAVDAALIPDFCCYDAPGFVIIHGTMDVAANYELITDNLLDLTHGEFVHEGLLSSEAITISKLETLESGTTLWANRWCPDGEAPPVWGQLMNDQLKTDPSTRVDHWLYMRWDAPAHCLLDVGITPVGKTRDDGVWVYTGHHLTPISSTRSLYHWSVVRNHGLTSVDVENFWRMSIDAAFVGQDKPIIEAQQVAIGDRHVDDLSLVAIPADIAGGKARRILRRLIDTETKGMRPQPGASSRDQLLAKSAGSRAPVLPLV